MTRTRHILKGTAALILLTVLLGGIPTGLWYYIGWPLPHAMPTWSQLRDGLTRQGIPDDVLIKTLAVVVWIAWGSLVFSVGAEASAAVRGHTAGRVRGLGIVQTFAGHLVAAVVLAFMSLTPRTAGSHTPSLAVIMQPVAAPPLSRLEPTVLTSAPLPGPLHDDAAPTPAPTFTRYTVQRRDTLWGIAERHLGDPLRWPEIFRPNEGLLQPDGGRLTNPNLIRPGWVVLLPVEAAEPSPSPSPPVSAAPAPLAPSPSPKPPSRACPPSQRPRSPAHHRHSNHGIELPSGTLVGIGVATAVSAGLTLARLRRRAAYQPCTPRPGLSRSEPGVSDTLRRLHHAAQRAEGHGIDPEDDMRQPEPMPNLPGGVIAIGERGDSQETIDLLAGHLDIDGAGSLAVVRALTLEAVGSSTRYEATILVAGHDLARQVFGDQDFDGLIEETADLPAALARLEVEMIRRTRLLAEADADDYRAYTTAHPEDPLPLLLAIHGTPDPSAEPRLAAIQTVISRLGIVLIGVGCASQSRRLTVAKDGLVMSANGFEGWEGAHLYRVMPSDVAEILGSLTVTAEHSPATGRVEEQETPESFPSPRSPEIELDLLGLERLKVGGEEITSGLRAKARELLALLAANPDGLTWEAAVDALWPDADREQGNNRFRTLLTNIRGLRDKLVGPDREIIERTGVRYRLNHSLFLCDLWRFEQALDVVAQADAENDRGRAGIALQHAAELYRGDFCQGSYYGWGEPIREDQRRKTLDILVRIAERQRSAGNLEAAANTLEKAIQVDDIAEAIYQQLIQTYGRLSRPDAARRVFTRLERRLDEIDRDPAVETIAVLKEATDSPARRLRSIPTEQ